MFTIQTNQEKLSVLNKFIPNGYTVSTFDLVIIISNQAFNEFMNLQLDEKSHMLIPSPRHEYEV